MPVPPLPIPHPGPCRLLRRFLALPLLLLLAATPLFAKGSDSPLRIPLEPLGFQPVSNQFLLQGSSLFTLHYVDDRHLLLTFTVRRLLTRLPDDPETDQDRNVDALLLELPTGRILAQTSWRLHDHGQYLWELGHGHFLLRIRSTLSTFAPLANLSTGRPFVERPLMGTTERRIGAILLSPSANFLIVETLPLAPHPQETAGSVQINFYRVSNPSEAKDEIKLAHAGVVRANAIGNIASTTAGYLAIVDQGSQHWAFDFNTYAGKTSELSPFDSTCQPSPFFVSRSEFIAFGCRSGNTRQLVGGFNMRGEEMWEQNLYGEYVAPTLIFAPASGRFAFGRVLTHASSAIDLPGPVDDASTQTVAVYQTSSGKQILHADCSPVERAGQNFTLSPNGLGLAVIHADAIEIYTLPSLTAQESAEVKRAEASAPEETDTPVHFASARETSSGNETTAAVPAKDSPATASPQPTPITSSTQSLAVPEITPAADSSTPSGDAPPEQHRKAPTLYTLPTDPPHTPADDHP
jgi:hypothetical protein